VQTILSPLRALVVVLLAGVALPRAGAAQPPAPEDLQQLWADLGAKDPVKVDRALTGLVAQSARAVPFVRQRLRAVAPPDPRRLDGWLADLDSEEFEVRERASLELGRQGEVIEADLKRVLRGRISAEVRRRVESLLEAVKAERLSPPAEWLRAARAVEVLERVGDCAARRLLTALAGGAPEAQLTIEAKSALERLLRGDSESR
jgi:hypothetical protein